MNDYIISALAANGYVRAYAATTRNLVQKAREIHETTPVVTAALGRLLTATSIMGRMLKSENDVITCQIRGDGPINGLIATGYSDGTVKGYPYNNYVDIPVKPNGKLDVSGAIGAGYLSVSKDLGLKEPYTGQIPLVTSEIAEDFAQYYVTSEQTPSAVALGVLVDVDYTVKQSGGVLIQLMPGASEELADKITNRLAEMDNITKMLEDGKTPETILEWIFEGLGVTFQQKYDVKFSCNCNREKLHKVVVALGEKDLREILEQDEKITIKCHFCNSEYSFDEAELTDILASEGSD